MRTLDQSPEVLRLDLVHLSRVRQRASENTVRSAKRNKELIDAVTTAMKILDADAYGTNGKREART